MATSPQECRHCANATVWICFLECLFIAAFKTIIGLTGGSKAMLGSALYSLTDLISSFLLIVSSKISGQPADRKHPYGHGKIEYIVSLLMGLIIMAGTVALLLFSVFSLYRVDLQPLHWIGLWASLACLCLSHIVYRLVRCAAQQTHSAAMLAHAKHVRLDSISNIAVVVAILAAEAGFPQVDAIIATLEAAHILIECSRMVWRAANQLMDASIDEEYLDQIQALIAQDPDVRQVRDVKGTYSGRGLVLNVEILLDGSCRIEDCDATVRTVEDLVRNKVDGVDSIHIHYHPYPGEKTVGGEA